MKPKPMETKVNMGDGEIMLFVKINGHHERLSTAIEMNRRVSMTAFIIAMGALFSAVASAVIH